MNPLPKFVARFVPSARRSGRGFAFSCPSEGHGRGRGDRNRSGSIHEAEDGQLLIHCHGGCRTEDILAALGARWSDLFAEGSAKSEGRLPAQQPMRHRRSIRIDLGLARSADIPDLAREARKLARGWPLEQLSKDTGPSVESYERIPTGYLVGDLAERAGLKKGSSAYVFLMQLPEGPVCGIRVRGWNGKKWAVEGSRNGLLTPEGVDLRHDRLVLCEGPTDTAALLDLGFPAVGRASATSGVELCETLAQINTAGQIVIFRDNDGPGMNGASKCAAAVSAYCDDVRIVSPPVGIKDVRAWLNAGAMHADVESLIEAASVAVSAQPKALEGRHE